MITHPPLGAIRRHLAESVEPDGQAQEKVALDNWERTRVDTGSNRTTSASCRQIATRAALAQACQMIDHFRSAINLNIQGREHNELSRVRQVLESSRAGFFVSPLSA